MLACSKLQWRSQGRSLCCRHAELLLGSNGLRSKLLLEKSCRVGQQQDVWISALEVQIAVELHARDARSMLYLESKGKGLISSAGVHVAEFVALELPLPESLPVAK